MKQRSFLKLLLASGFSSQFVPSTSRAQSAPAAASGPFNLPPLPYAPNALEPYIDAETMTLHHGKHHAAYVNNLNKAIAPYPDLKKKSAEELLQSLDSLPADIRTTVRNNAGGHVNHSHLWKTLKNPGTKPSGKLAKEIDQTFGSYDRWKDEMTKTSLGVFGSGWAWFARGKDGKLFIKPYPNQDSPVMEGGTLIYGIDVWEHAYYLKYRNLRTDYVKACLNILGAVAT